MSTSKGHFFAAGATGSNTPSRSSSLGVAIVAVFLLGLMLRVIAMGLPPSGSLPAGCRWQPERCSSLEGDEQIYIALTEQLVAGKGYTLQGHPILRQPWIALEQYDRPLFFHPPGGIALFWLTRRVAGNAGYALAQVLSFAIFFWSTLLLGCLVLQPINRITALALSGLAAFTPIMAHVAGFFWLDGPVLGFSTAAVAVFVLGIQRRSTLLVCLAAALLGYASLIKLTALLVIPGAVALARVVTPRMQDGDLVLRSLLFVALAGLIQLPWEIWQWQVVGSAFPAWAGKPAEQLVRMNRYVHYVTVVRQPWIYLELLPQVIWTLVPSLVLLGMQWRNRELRRRGVVLLLWIVWVVGFHVALGAIGYSKVLRYVILCTPATVLLFALVLGGVVEAICAREWLPGGREVTIAMLLFAAIGLGLEVTQGLQTSIVDNRMISLVRPLPLLHWILD